MIPSLEEFATNLKPYSVDQVRAMLLQETGREVAGTLRDEVIGNAYECYKAKLSGQAMPAPAPAAPLSADAFGKADAPPARSPGRPPKAEAPPPAPRGPIQYELRSRTGQPFWLNLPGDDQALKVGTAWGAPRELSTAQLDYLHARKAKLVAWRVKK